MFVTYVSYFNVIVFYHNYIARMTFAKRSIRSMCYYGPTTTTEKKK